ncbi:hypothetical protein WDZ16_06975 [Pseudokineococcus marinus]|uniref:Tat pathway signal sequence domain protein n=1 Tax=Pseudokineococcus marinus TaxID=351215 RepID=A0A849BR29_9ACTN|nr:Tat pathway signal sequence domain protein [Pseudokineococcus marinus]NNH22964.1 Tat pathway signal sequence domain protein [Pseudokineococcus marinus]
MDEHRTPTHDPRRAPSRRAVLAGATGAGALALAVAPATGAAAAPPSVATPSLRRAGARALDFLQVMSDAYPAANGDGPVLAQSYSDQNGLFSTAFVYDEALSICAALATGTERGEALARRLGDGLLFAQGNDPAYDDGRLRQAYNVGPYVFYDGVPQPYGLRLPDGTANIGFQFGFLGTAVGDMAWPGMALVQLHERTGEQRYLDGALAVARWITTNARNDGALGGFSFGVTAGDERIPNVSTEHNVDCVGFFRQLAAATRDRSWLEEADRARAFLGRVWEPDGGYFYTGSDDGTTVNTDPLPLDPQAWSWLALREGRYARALDWAGQALAVTDDAAQPLSQLPDGVRVSGVTFSSASLTSTAVYNGLTVDPQGVWLEGTGQLATAYADRGRGQADARRARGLLGQITVAQDLVGQDQTVGGAPLPADSGVVAATSVLDTGFGFAYFQSQHIGATAWFLMGVEGANPFVRGGLR